MTNIFINKKNVATNLAKLFKCLWQWVKTETFNVVLIFYDINLLTCWNISVFFCGKTNNNATLFYFVSNFFSKCEIIRTMEAKTAFDFATFQKTTFCLLSQIFLLSTLLCDNFMSVYVRNFLYCKYFASQNRR